MTQQTLTTEQHEAISITLEAERAGSYVRRTEVTKVTTTTMGTTYEVRDEIADELIEMGLVDARGPFSIKSNDKTLDAITTPAPAPTQAQAAKPVKLSKAQRETLTVLLVCDCSLQFRASSMKSGGWLYITKDGGYAATTAKPPTDRTAESLRKHGLIDDTSDNYGLWLTPAGRAALGLPVESAVEVKSAPEAPKTAIVYRNIAGHIQPHSIDRAKCQHTRVSGRFLMDSGSMATPMGYCNECGACVEWPTPAKPASTSPALVETGERVIRLPLLPTTPLLPSGNNAVALLPAYCPIALPSEVVEIGGTEYRITSHGTIISIEKRDSAGNWQHEANYGSAEQVKRFLERMERESNQPAPDNFTPERIASAKARADQAESDYQAFRAQMADNGAAGKYRGGHKQTRAVIDDAQKLHDLDKRRQQLETAYQQMTALANPELPVPPAPQPIQVDPRLTTPLLEALKVLSHVPQDTTLKNGAHVWGSKTTEDFPGKSVMRMYRIAHRIGEGLCGMGYAKMVSPTGIEITPAGRTALQATFKSSAVNSKTGKRGL